jgi:hypothetical protein
VSISVHDLKGLLGLSVHVESAPASRKSRFMHFRGTLQIYKKSDNFGLLTTAEMVEDFAQYVY